MFFSALNRRASLITCHQLFGDVVFIPNSAGTHLYNLLRQEFVQEYNDKAAEEDVEARKKGKKVKRKDT